MTTFMMGNQRQLLKNNIEKELVSKIETAKDVIHQINKNLEINKQNSLSAKEEIRKTNDAIKEILIQRKKELIKEVESLHCVQARSLQDAMRSTYITMGKLQSMLTNLDSFDQSQLLELQIPQLAPTSVVSEPPQINVSLECEQLKEDIQEWGNVTTEDGFQCCITEKAAPSVSSFKAPETPALEPQNVLSSTMCENKENQTVPKRITAVCESCPWKSWGIENWLRGPPCRKMSIESLNPDDFLMVSPCSETSDMEDFVVPSSGIDNGSNPIIPAERENESDKSGSSIICVDKDMESEQGDLSEWLKQGKSSKLTVNRLSSKDNEVPFKHNAMILSCDPKMFLCAGKRSACLMYKKRNLDFPCLAMEAENWVHQKKAKSLDSSSSSSSLTSSISAVAYGPPKLIPPAYALPNPFWLKKYQHRR